MSFLPPVMLTVGANAAEFHAVVDGVIAQLERMAASTEATMTAASAAWSGMEAKTGTAAAATGAAAAEVAAGMDRVPLAAETAASGSTVALGRIDAALSELVASAKITADSTAGSFASMAAAQEAAAARAEAAAAKQRTAFGITKTELGKVSDVGKTVSTAIAGTGLVVAGVGIDMAAKFQASTTKLVTSAGETDDGLKTVRDGLLSLSGEVGVGAEALSDAMYKVESAGYHSAAGLGLLKAAEQGAKAEGADGAKVADALSSALRDYYPHAQSAADVTAASTDVMSKLIGATSAGKMTFDELSGSLNSVLPVASAANISLSDTLGTLASMTVHGISAEQATQNMADAIRHLQAPTATMSKEMAALGIDSTDVAAKLGERGLSGTMQMLSEKVKAAMPPGADKVILDLGNALSKSSPQVQELGQQLMAGSITMKDFTNSAKELDPISAGQANQFATLAKSTHQIGNQMVSGADVMQTYGGAMAKVMGDATGLKVALMTTGENADYTKSAIKTVSDATADASGNVKGYAEVQQNASQKLAQLKGTLGAVAIDIGNMLLPAVVNLANGLKDFVGFIKSHEDALPALAAGAGLVAAAFAGLGFLKTVQDIKEGIDAFKSLASAMKLAEGAQKAAAAAQWLLNAAMDANPIGIVITIIAALVAGVVLAYNNIGWFKDGVDAAFKFIGEAVQNVGHWFGDVWNGIVDVWNGAVGFFAGLGQGIVDGWNGVLAFFGAIGQWFADVWNAIVSGVTGFVNGFVAVFQSVVSFLQPVIDVFAAMFGALGAIIGFEVKVYVFLFQTIVWALQQAAGFIGQVLGNIGSFFATVWGGIVSVVSTAVNFVAGIIRAVWSGIAAFLTPILTAIGSFIATVWDGAVAVIGGALNAIWGVVSAIWGAISGFIGGVLSAIGDTVAGAWNGIVSSASSILGGLYDAVTGAWNTVANWAGGLAGQVGDWFAGAGSWLLDAGSKIIGGLLDGLKGMWDQVAGFFKDLTDKIPSWKGPIDRDRTLLTGAGKAIMGSLVDGLESQYDTVRGSLSDFTDSLQSTGTPGVNVALTGRASAPSAGSGVLTGSGTVGPGSTITNNITVNAKTDAKPRDIATAIGTQLQQLI